METRLPKSMVLAEVVTTNYDIFILKSMTIGVACAVDMKGNIVLSY